MKISESKNPMTKGNKKEIDKKETFETLSFAIKNKKRHTNNPMIYHPLGLIKKIIQFLNPVKIRGSE